VESPERLQWGFLQCVGCLGRELGIPTFAVHHANYVAIIEGAGAAVPLLRLPGPAWFMKQVTRHVYNQFDRTIVHSVAAVDYLAKYGVPAERVTQCPFLGVNTETFHPGAARASGPGELARFTNLRRLDPKSVVFLYVGRISEEKQIPVLVEAFGDARERLGARGVAAHLAIVGGGDGDFVANLAREAAKVGAVLPGPVDNDKLAGVYALCDVFVTPSPIESAGLTVLEACAAGAPVIGADAGGVGELVNERVGRKFAPGSAAALADAMVELGADTKLRATLGKAAVAYAEENSIVAATRRMVDIWDVAVAGARAGKVPPLSRPVSPFERLPSILVLLAMCAAIVPLAFPTTVAGVLLLAAYAAVISFALRTYRANQCCWCHAPVEHMALTVSLAGLQFVFECLWRLVRLLGIRKRKCWERPYLETMRGWIGLGGGGKEGGKRD
jgi:glycosyltransferase involved in cell wall biosynthesis